MIKAKKIYSKDALANPRVKQALGKLSPTDRVIQICGIEALEQIRHHRPDIVPDMMAQKIWRSRRFSMRLVARFLKKTGLAESCLLISFRDADLFQNRNSFRYLLPLRQDLPCNLFRSGVDKYIGN